MVELYNSFDTKENTMARYDTISFLLCKTDENNSKLPKPLENNGKWVWRVYKQHKNLMCRSSMKDLHSVFIPNSVYKKKASL